MDYQSLLVLVVKFYNISYSIELNVAYQFITTAITMDIKDFQGLMKYKIFVPIVYICSWMSMIFGPVFFRSLYQKICIFVLVYTNVKVIIMFTIMIIITIKSQKVFKRAIQEQPITDASNRDYLDSSQEINYGFIIPSYREDIEMIAETLDVLAVHKRSRQRYLIFLAMEAHEEGSDLKAQQLMARYKEKFRVIQYTRHEVKEFEQKGKASNVSWCAQHLQPFFEKYMINPDTIMLTIMDADSWAPNIYFDLMEEHLIKHYEKRHTLIYQPPQIFTRNHLDVPVFTRVYDLMHSFAHCSNLFSVFDITFPLSNYSLSYNLVKRIGFWDTCADAIGEDFHTTQKAFWKTGGQITTVPIYAPFNQVNISTSNGYIEDVLARFWQAERHAQGISDLAWEFKMLFTNKFRPMNLVIFYQIFETFTLPGILPWIFLSMTLQSNILFHGFDPSTTPEMINPILSSVLFNVMSILSIVGYMLYEIFKRRANKIIYHKENQSILRVLEYPIFFTVNLFSMSVPTFTLAAFGSLFSNREYIVAEKKNTTSK